MTIGHLSARLVALVGFATAATTLAGCPEGPNESYSCDDSGCTVCDAYGCATVAAPPKTACSTDATCPAGSTCTAFGCAASCQGDLDCPRGERCAEGQCLAPGQAPGTTPVCETNAQCGDGASCVGNVCQACGGNAGPCACAGPEDCGAGQACVNGACAAKANTCQFTSECEAGKVCADGQCLAACEPGPCAAGTACDDGVCKPVPTGQCTADETCPANAPKCVGGACVAACQADTECGAGRYCNQGACVPDTRPKPNCADDTQCGGGATARTCVEGFCKYRCASDQQCRTIDARIGYCARDGVCRTAAEAQAECTGPGQCPDGKSCVDNRCR